LITFSIIHLAHKLRFIVMFHIHSIVDLSNVKKSVALICFSVLFSNPLGAISLQEAIKDTLSKNPSVEAARQQMLAVENQISVAKSGYLPTLDLELGIGREGTVSPNIGAEEVILTREEIALRLRQVIYNGSAVSSENAIQKARYQSAMFTVIDTQENAALRTAEVYLSVLRQAENLALLKESLDEHETIHNQMTKRSRAGVGTQADLNQVKVRLSLATSAHIEGKQLLLNAISQFKALTGYLPDATMMKVPSGFSMPASLDSSLDTALQQHPAIKYSQANIEVSQARQKAAKRANHPTLALEGDRTWNEDIDGIEGKNEDWVIALRLRYNIFNGGADKARSKQSVNLLQQSIEEHQQIRWQTEESMRLSWHSYEASLQRLEYLNVHVESAIATRKAYGKQYKVNKRSLIELLNVQNEVTRAQQSYLTTQYEQLLAQVRILNALGELTTALGLNIETEG